MFKAMHVQLYLPKHMAVLENPDRQAKFSWLFIAI